MGKTDRKDIYKIIGKSILFASMQFAIGSVEMSSKFSVKNFSKDQETLQHAADALRDYIIIGFLWTIGTCLIFYTSYGVFGIVVNLITNLLIVLWIYLSYLQSFKSASIKNNLQMPKIF